MRLASDLAHISLQDYRQLDAGCWVSSYKQTNPDSLFKELVGKVLKTIVFCLIIVILRSYPETDYSNTISKRLV
jgi:hypothetical protein